jgi:hypothetical protein
MVNATHNFDKIVNFAELALTEAKAGGNGARWLSDLAVQADTPMRLSVQSLDPGVADRALRRGQGLIAEAAYVQGRAASGDFDQVPAVLTVGRNALSSALDGANQLAYGVGYSSRELSDLRRVEQTLSKFDDELLARGFDEATVRNEIGLPNSYPGMREPS